MLLTKNHIFFIQVKLRMLPNEGQGNEKPSQEQPSTSTTTEKPKWLQKLGAVGLTDEKLIEHREKFKQAIRHRCQQLKEKYDGLDWELPPVVQRRLAKWRQGWQRVLAIFPSESAGQGQIHQPPSLEWRLLQSSFWISGTIGFLHGGNTSVGESARRFELYAVGKNFGTLGYAMRRQTDYVVSRYFMRGFSKGALTAGTVCTIIGLVLGTTAYRDCYSLLYVPISAVSMLSVYTFSRGLGLAGLYAALWIAIVPSSILTAATLGGCWYAGTSVDEGYKRLRAIHHEEAMQKEEERAQLAQYMRSRKHFFVPWAKRRMREEKALGTWEPANTEEGNENQELVNFVEQLERAEAEEEGEKKKK